MGLIAECKKWSASNPKTVVFPDSNDVRVFDAINTISANGWLNPVLVGNPLKLRDSAQAAGYNLEAVDIVDPTSARYLDKYAPRLLDKLSGKAGVTDLESARKKLSSDPLWFAASMLEAGDTDMAVAGNTSSTADVLRAAIRVVGSAPGINSVSSLFFMISPNKDKVLAFSDCGVLPKPSTEQLVDIAISTSDSFKNVTGIEPKVAMLSFSTSGSVDHELVRPMRDATRIARTKRPDLIIDGELQFDAAFVPDVASRKVPDSVVAGDANVFVFPDLNAGNIAYKIAQRMAGYTALGPLIQGLDKPFHDLSRGCSANDIVEVSLVGARMSFGSN